ncbi:thioredoxin domain-containing protein [Ktedonospora formicarum]|uniref:Thioredoxin domain-containing protein n=1 Tax=Ktedonospora formicarum TaxID=2778364 RepID=A0A8J3I1Z2_9CHLR|nr:thioredoxin domain-containing protein [Ktedonospora formicarum]GHO44767.1 thioredoxin domain-containing protein [Ktedonospora formicarum]
MPEEQARQGEHTYTNRLIHETSPYLLQHAHNPVDWYPWGDEALQKARQEDKPILLSVGYSACHWCHVMEHESFENPEIASLMNQHFVSIKVDREERPDIDNIYMQAVQAMTQQGGWPMTVVLMPDGRPFYGGTYFPPDDRRHGQYVMPGFRRVLLSLAQLYAEEREKVEEQAEELAQFLRQRGNVPLRSRSDVPRGKPELSMLAVASQALASDFDAQHGGFGGAPKFPHSMALEFLLRMHQHRSKDELEMGQLPGNLIELEIVERSLMHMAHGGIYDQLGGGFHRYSVDAEWLVPHFEKMLYDNALLSRCYLSAYLVTGKAEYRRIVEETLDYVAREMTSPEGGFYSTQDADSEGVEGKFFLWQPAEIEKLLSAPDAAIFMRYYDVTARGNFEGKNILHINVDLQQLASELTLNVDEVRQILAQGRKQLFAARELRIKPGRDEKILTSWNGLMLRSFAEAARHLERSDYLQLAINNANFLLSTMRQDGRLLRTYKDGRARLKGYLEDYAFLADGLLALYQASFDPHWFAEARALMDQALLLFSDQEQGGFFDTGSDHEELVSRPKDIMDNATPAGNSVAADVLLRLTALSSDDAYRERAESYVQSIADVMVQHPQFFGQALSALDFSLSTANEIALAGATDAADTRALLHVVNARYLPNSVLACGFPDDEEATRIVPLLAERTMKGNQATAYVCQNFVCQAPVTTVEALEQLL